jgi:hypothetical protein
MDSKQSRRHCNVDIRIEMLALKYDCPLSPKLSNDFPKPLQSRSALPNPDYRNAQRFDFFFPKLTLS